jgi:ribonuclease HI
MLFGDGGSRGNPGPAASGIVLYDERGIVVREVGEYLGIATNNVAEWTALIIGLETAAALGVSALEVRMDSELVVKQVNGIYKVKHPALIPLHAKARTLVRKFAMIHIAHVRRNQNAAADAVVNAVLDARKSFAREGTGAPST